MKAMDVILYITQHPTFDQLVVVEGGIVQDWFIENSAAKGRLDTIYVGCIVDIKGQTAFVDIGLDRSGLLSFSSKGRRLTVGQKIFVQVNREASFFMPAGSSMPIEEKGVRLTQNLTFASAYHLYQPLKSSQWISRTAAEGASSESLKTSKDRLQKQYQAVCLEVDLKRAPHDVMPGPSFIHRLIRDGRVQKIRVQGRAVYERVQQVLAEENKTALVDLQLHIAVSPQASLLQQQGLQEDWEILFEPTVSIPGGGQMIIEETACATTIDLNQGRGKDAVHINQAAVPVLCQQIQWRHLAGNMIIDFIGLDALKGYQREARAVLVAHLKKEAEHLRLNLDILGWAPCGWLQVCRPKRTASLAMQHKALTQGRV